MDRLILVNRKMKCDVSLQLMVVAGQKKESCIESYTKKNYKFFQC